MRYIFFDVDGVLNGTDQNGNWIDDEIQIDKLNCLIELSKATNSKLVMSSTWRKAWNTNGELIKENEWTLLLDNLLREANCKLYSITPMCDCDRNKEIKLWLKENANSGDKFVCLDDEHTAPSHCDGCYGKGDVVGLFKKHVEQATKILLA